jgi:hypothetical protein
MRPEFQDIVDDVSRILGGPVTLEDRDFNLIAFCSQHAAQIDQIRQQSILERHSTDAVRALFEQFGIATSEQPVRVPAMPESGVLPRLCLPARWNGVTYGYVWLLDENPDHDAAQEQSALALAERAGALLAQQVRVREELDFKLQDVLSPEPEIAEIAAADIDDRGIIARGVPVAAVELRLATQGAAQPVPMNLWSLPRSVLASAGDEHTTLVVPLHGQDLGPARAVAERARELYAERLPPGAQVDVVAGIGAPRPDLSEARGSWQEARLASQAAQSVSALRPVAVWPELGVYRLLACGPQAALSSAVLDHSVHRLLDCGDDDLVHTAATYLDTGGNVHAVAEALRIHRQTVYHRLQRIEQVTGLTLSRGQDRLVLHLGLTMAPLIGGPGGPNGHGAGR